MIIDIFPCQNFTKKTGCKFGDQCLLRHAEADSQPMKKVKKSGGTGSVALLKNSKHLGCVFQDTEPPKSKSILRKSTKSLGSDRAVRISKGTERGVILKCELHERSLCDPKIEDRTQEETLQQERCARREAWDLAKHVHKLNNKDKATFCSLSEIWSLTVPSSKKLEERFFVVGLGASMHMLIRKDLNSAELETVRVSRTPTTAITANGEVQTNEEAQVFVHDLELFVTVHILEDTLAVLSLGKLCEEHRYSYEWACGQKPLLNKQWHTHPMQHDNSVPMAVPVLPTGSSSSSASTSSTSSPQDTIGSIASSPGTQQSGDTNAQASSNPSRDLTKSKNKNTERGQRCMEKSIARFPRVGRGVHR